MKNIIKEFLINKYEDNIALVDDYTKIAKNILYEDPEIIIKVTKKLRKNITDFAIKNSETYKNHTVDKIYSRKDLSKDIWPVKHLENESKIMKTSGSTTGEPFSYMIHKKHYNFIEDDNQYGLILEEFEIDKKHIDILILANLRYNPVLGPKQFYLIQKGYTTWSLHNHRAESSTRYFVNFHEYNNTEDWYYKLLELFNKKFFDIILTTGPVVNLLRHYLIKFGYNKKICKLMNQTTEFLIQDDIKFLKENNYIDNYCDSMRCWDGGATFFTCKHNTYHLMDNLSWVESRENKIISTDYFSFAEPFVNYWNGDLCELDNKYKKCLCKRYYRPFKMLENRPFGIKGPTKLTEIKEKINNLYFKEKLICVNFDNLKAIITVKQDLNQNETENIKEILKNFNCTFINLSKT